MRLMTTIRREQPDDIAAVHAINKDAFGQCVEADLVDALRDGCPDALSLVAVSEGRVVGHILFTPVTILSGQGETRGMGLGPMAVASHRQRRGIGSQLVEAGLQILREEACPFVVVLGHPAYYPRFGFVPASRHGLTCQWEGVPDDAFMVLVLDKASMVGVSGTIRYRDEFHEAV
jgi:putative acetyltransferase